MKQKGFTLIELVVSVAVFGILVAIGLPSFTDFIRSYTAESTMMSLHKDLQLARNEAVSLRERVTVCNVGSIDGGGNAQCTGNWLNGITVFVDSGTIGTLESGELVLAQSNPIGTEHSFHSSASSNRITFRSDGQAAGFATMMVFCPNGSEEKNFRGLIINNNGRVRATRDDKGNDGIHEDGDGNNLTCG